MKETKTRIAPPRADGTIEALRGLGYTIEAALADLIDNSISAGASHVDIDFIWAGRESWISVRDDGRGMSDPELDRAMRLAELSPIHARKPEDLGRFGMGLKTASFSQCRRLTVASKQAGQLSCLRWDLDYLARQADGNWLMLEGAHIGSEAKLSSLESMAHGTVVLWEELDRVVSSGFTEKVFLEMIDQVERHLGMVFHRFLDRSGPSIGLRINGQPVQPWDPFLAGHSGTWSSPQTSIGAPASGISAKAFVLPHKDRLKDREYIEAGGPDGWSSQQGFYIYRGRRLLVPGSWLGLGRGRSWSKDESHRLARIRLDIPNSSDDEWKIDIRKATAHPPVRFREQLTRLAEDTRERARRVFLHRTQPASTIGAGAQPLPVWVSRDLVSGRVYRVDRSHPAAQALLAEGGDVAVRTEALLRVLEETIPVQRIWLDTTETGEQAKGAFTADPDESVIQVIRVLYKNLLLRKGASPQIARNQLLTTEPFNLYPDLVNSLPDTVEGL